MRLEINGILVEEGTTLTIPAGEVLIIRGVVLENREPVQKLKVVFKLFDGNSEYIISQGETDRFGIVSTTYEFPTHKIGETIRLECLPEGVESSRAMVTLKISR